MSDALQPSPHDALFRHAFTQLESAAGLLRALLPAEVVEEVDWDALELCEGSQVDAALRELESDLVFSARSGEREVLFYVLVEHQSSSDPWMVWRLWRYVTGVWERWMRDHPDARKLPRVIPVVVFHGARPWSAARSITLVASLRDGPPPPAPALRASTGTVKPSLAPLRSQTSSRRSRRWALSTTCWCRASPTSSMISPRARRRSCAREPCRRRCAGAVGAA